MSRRAAVADELNRLEDLRSLFEAVAALGDRAEGVYLVGGTVRDVLLGEKSFDVDIAVEGDAIEFARALAETLDGRATPHERFGTAVVSYGDDARVDVVTTRTEFYDAPAALPTVERAGLREDLFRRDFTINAMAASLKPADFGRLIDPFGGRADLEAGVLRVLHNLSFIDDPTRIFRGIRYEARYGLRLEEHSARLARGCIEMGLVGDLSSARLRDELVTLLEDPGAAGGILRLGELGADRAVHAHLKADAEAVALFVRALALRDELDVELPAWRVGLAALGRELTSEEVYDWLERLKVRRRDVDRIAGAVDCRASDSRTAARGGAGARRGDRARGCVRTGRTAARARAGGASRAPRVLHAAPRRQARDRRRRVRRARTRGVAARRRGARRAAPAEVERGDRRARVRARRPRVSCWRRPPNDGRVGLRDRRALRAGSGRRSARGVTVVVATKYVSLEDMATLAEAGIEVVGENRAQDLDREARALRERAFAGTSSAIFSRTRSRS